MKKGLKRRILSLVLCVSMISQIISVQIAGAAESYNDANNYGSAIGAVAEWDVGYTWIYSEPQSSDGFIVRVEELPARVTITDYFINMTGTTLWYKVEAAPGYTWPQERYGYNWVKAKDLKIISQNGLTGLFDKNGNPISELTMGVYSKPVIYAETSLQGDVTYQWQICYDTEKDLWVDIYGQNDEKLKVSISILASILGEDGTALLRCVTACSAKRTISEPITIVVDFNDVSGDDNTTSEPELEIWMDGASAEAITTTYGNSSFEKSLTAFTNLSGDVTYKWEMLANSANDQWTELSTEASLKITYDDLDFKGYDANSDCATLRLTVSNNEIELSDTFVVYRIAPSYITNSAGNTIGSVDVTVSGSLPDDAVLNLKATDDSVPGVDESEISLTLDVTITQSGTEWQPNEGETVRVLIPAAQLGLSDGQYFAVYHIHNDKTELLGPYLVENGYVTFDIDGFSTIVISTNYGAAIGGTASWTNGSAWLYSDHSFNSSGRIVATSALPAKLVIKDYFLSETGARSTMWYKVDAAPGYSWNPDYSDFHWVTADRIKDVNFEGEMGLFNEEGAPVTRVEMPVSSKPVYSVDTTLQGEVKYQWQICYDIANYLWMDIEGQTAESITLSYALLSNVLDEGNMCAVRCVVSNSAKTQYGYPLVIEVTEDTATATVSEESATNEQDEIDSGIFAKSFLRSATPRMYAMSNAGIATAAETNNTVLVTVQFVMGNDTVPIENGLFTYQVPNNGSVTDIITIPTVTGYAAYLEDDRATVRSGTYNLNLSGVTEEKTITFRFWPAEVEYKVEYLQQNIFDDNYTVVKTEELVGLTGSDPVIENLTYEGFAQIWCDADKIAADGSTVIQVRYDRLYFKMLFDLDGGYGVQPVYARYGTPITVINPTKAGYTFMGWDSDGDGEVDIQNFENIAIPAEHTNYTAIWKASDSAKVTVVIWGQNPNDNDYSYLADESANLSFNAKPGASVTYNPNNGGYICGYTEEHTHGTGCEASCGKTEHTTHTDACYACGQTPHTHSKNCYTIDGYTEGWFGSQNDTTLGDAATDANIISQLNSAQPDGKGVVNISVNNGYWNENRNYVKLAGTWYRINNYNSSNFSCTLSCGVEENSHVHNESCGFNCNGIHNHTAACYEGCTKEEHTHGAACSLTVNIDRSLWTYSHSDTVTVSADGSTVMNVYYTRTTFTITFKATGNNGSTLGTITDRWGADIRQRFENECKEHTFLWSQTRNGDSPWTSFLDVMPDENRTYYAKTTTSNNVQTAKYWGADLNGEYTVLLYTSAVKYGNNLTVSKEEFIDIEGYKFAYGIDGDGDRMNSAGSYGDFDGANFYYNRANFNLVFDNYGTTFKNESVLYEAPLSSYSTVVVPNAQAPDVYQDGSVVFKGWYLAPQSPYDFDFSKVEPFDFTSSTMPANDLKLYAWWEPVTHNVTFYYDLVALEAGDVYTVDGHAYNYNVPHGSIIQDPNTPPKDPTSSYYSFVGWFYKTASGQESMWDFTNTTVTENVKLYAKWTSNTPAEYEVRYITIKDGVKIDIAEPEIGMALGGDNKKFDAKFGEDLYAGYQTRYYPTTMSHSITIDLENTENNYYEFVYEYVEYTSYTVKYLDKETGNELLSTVTVSNNTHAMVTEQFVPIAGYLPDAYQKVCYIDPDGTNEIVFYYTKDTENGLWVVHYWLEDADGNFVENIDLQFTGTAKDGAVVTSPTNTVIPNYTYDADNSKNVSSGTVSVKEITHLHMYYERNLVGYKVQYLEYGTDKVLAPEKVGNLIKWGSHVVESAKAIENYTVQGASQYEIEISVDEEDNVITFYYVEKTVTINYVPLNGGSVDRATETVKVVTGTIQGSTAKPEPGFKFVGWYSDAACTQQVSESTNYVPNKVSATYYAKFEYDLTSLTITKTGWDKVDPNQTFIFNISGNGVDLDVTVHGNGSITIDGLTVGKTYTITEKTNWSWRYENAGWTHGKDSGNGESATITIGLNGEIIFNNERPNYQWLDGDSYKVNIFKKKED